MLFKPILQDVVLDDCRKLLHPFSLFLTVFTQNIEKAGTVDIDLEGYGILLSRQSRVDYAMLPISLLLLGLFSEEAAVGFDVLEACLNAFIQFKLQLINNITVGCQDLRPLFIPPLQLVEVLLLLGHCHSHYHLEFLHFFRRFLILILSRSINHRLIDLILRIVILRQPSGVHCLLQRCKFLHQFFFSWLTLHFSMKLKTIYNHQGHIIHHTQCQFLVICDCEDVIEEVTPMAICQFAHLRLCIPLHPPPHTIHNLVLAEHTQMLLLYCEFSVESVPSLHALPTSLTVFPQNAYVIFGVYALRQCLRMVVLAVDVPIQLRHIVPLFGVFAVVAVYDGTYIGQVHVGCCHVQESIGVSDLLQLLLLVQVGLV